MADVVVGAPLGRPRQQRQQRLGAVEGLDGRFLVNVDDHGPVGRPHVEGDDVADLVDEKRVVESLKVSSTQGFSPKAFQMRLTVGWDISRASPPRPLQM